MQITPPLGETTPATTPGGTAAGTSYDGSTSGSAETDVQAELDRLEALIAAGPSVSSFAPTYLGPGETWRIPDNRQALFSKRIVLDAGARIVVGARAALIQVS